MNITETKKALLAYLTADIPTFLWGSPGVGKSDAIRQVGEAQGWPVIDFRAILRDPVDLRGLPAINHEEKTAVWLPPSDLPNAERDGEEGILFLDELNAAPQSVQAACFGLVLDRKVGEYRLPPGWRIIAAGNRQSDRAAAQRMPSALANRFAHLDVTPTMDDFMAWAAQQDISPVVMAFLRFRPALLHAMPQNAEVSFPTPRAWHKTSNLLQANTHLQQAANQAFRFQLVKGIVGEGAATEFEGFVRIYADLPSLDLCLTQPKQAPTPKDISARYALASGLARKVQANTFKHGITYTSRLSKEFEVMFVVDAVKRNPALSHTKDFTEWAVDNQSVLI